MVRFGPIWASDLTVHISRMTEAFLAVLATNPGRGATAVLQAVERFDPPNNGWLKRLLTRKQRTVSAITLANTMARGLWAMMTKQKYYQNPVATMV